MTSCLVLGGAGFIGSHLVESLVQAGHRVKVFDQFPMHGRPKSEHGGSCERFVGDFLNPEDLAAAIPGSEVLFHLISTTLPHTSNADPVYDVETNVLATLRMLSVCRTHGVRKVIFLSSGGTVYGIPHTLPIAESHPTNPTCAYGIHKLAIEKYLRLEHLLHGLEYCVLRPSNLYGEGQRLHISQGAVGVFLDRAERSTAIEIWGDGSVVRDYVYVGDAVDAMVRAISYNGEPRIFNIGSGVGTSLNALLKLVEDTVGHPVAVVHAASRAFDVPINVLDSSLAQEHLGWSARTTLAAGVRKTREWLRAAR